jgi:hypothetical protein
VVFLAYERALNRSILSLRRHTDSAHELLYRVVAGFDEQFAP